ncbi:MAG TPA: ABC transporter permease [Terracidiphilus sp.]|nr:ABC transporter permease [Terracidiphilus sp.]
MIHFLPAIRLALRRYRHAPGPALAAILTLALGIGANTALFSLIDGVCLRPLAIADPAHLVAIASVKNHAAADSERDNTSSFDEYTDVRAGVAAFSDVAGVDHRGIALKTGDGLQLLTAEVVTDNFFTFMGARAELGHLPTESELAHAQSPMIVLSHATWQRVFGGDRTVIGRTITATGGSATIAAVVPSTFRGIQRIMDPQVYVPRSTWDTWFPSDRNSPRSFRNYSLYARLRPGVTLNQARAQLQGFAAGLAARYPQANAGRGFNADWEQKSQFAQFKVLAILLFAIGLAVLLIACVNIANLLLAMNDARRREMAMRTALGAMRGSLVGQLVTEYALLAIAGVTVAIVLAQRLIAVVPAFIPNVGFPLNPDFRIDLRVLAFTAIAGVLSVLVCGLIPAVTSTRMAPIEAMRDRASQGRLRMPARKIFVIAQVAISMALLVVTALFVRALMRVESMDLGFSASQNAAILEITTTRGGAERQAGISALAARARALPGVKDATVSRVVPFSLIGGGAARIVLGPGEPITDTAGTPVWFNQVDDDYFRVMGVPILRGRAFGSTDTPASMRVVIVNQTLARRFFGSVDVVGRQLRLDRKDTVTAEIVGVVADGKYGDIGEAPQPYFYRPLSQDAWSDMTLTATTAGDPRTLLPAMRAAVHAVDPDIIVIGGETLTDHMRLATYANRAAAWLTASLGALGLLLTIVGLYGVIAYSVSRRTREIGIRMALGARRANVGAAVLLDGSKLVLVGMVLGAALAIVAGRTMSSLLFGIGPADPWSLASVAALMLVVSATALLIPARRALQIEPAAALREE